MRDGRGGPASPAKVSYVYKDAYAPAKRTSDFMRDFEINMGKGLTLGGLAMALASD